MAHLLSREKKPELCLFVRLLSRICFVDRTVPKTMDIFACAINLEDVLFSKTLLTKQSVLYAITQSLALSSPISAVCVGNAWDHDHTFGDQTTYI